MLILSYSPDRTRQMLDEFEVRLGGYLDTAQQALAALLDLSGTAGLADDYERLVRKAAPPDSLEASRLRYLAEVRRAARRCQTSGCGAPAPYDWGTSISVCRAHLPDPEADFDIRKRWPCAVRSEPAVPRCGADAVAEVNGVMRCRMHYDAFLEANP